MKIKPLMTYAPYNHKFRFIRFIWTKGVFGSGGYDAMLSFSWMPKIFKFEHVKSIPKIRIVILGFSIHYKRSYGGRMT